MKFVENFNKNESSRAERFEEVWSEELDDAFTDIAPYYDRANHIASLGQWNRFKRKFQSIIDVQPGMEVLDVCAGTNAVGLALLERQPDLKIIAMDRSEAMQKVGQQVAEKRGFEIKSVIGDVHDLPFDDDSFDMVTMQWASRHTRVVDLFAEIRRVLKPQCNFYHCDMLRPENQIVESMYYAYLKMCLGFTSKIFKSGFAANKQKQYFIDALKMHYSAKELDTLLLEVGYTNVFSNTLLQGMVGFHCAKK